MFSCRLKLPRKKLQTNMENLKKVTGEIKARYGPQNLLVESFAV